MNRGVDRQPIFFTRSDGEEFERLVGIAHERYGVDVHAYCLMTNHFHLLVQCPRAGLGAFVQHVTGNYTRLLNSRRGRDGPLFRGRYRSVPVSDEGYVLAATRYIHRNPIDLGSVVDPAAYRWSSHGPYVGTRTPPAWLTTAHILGMFAGGREAFHDCVFGDLDERLRGHVLTQIAMMIDEAGVETARVAGTSRTVAHAVLDRVDERTRHRLLDELQLGTRAARRAAVRAEHRVACDPEVAQLVADVVRRIDGRQ